MVVNMVIVFLFVLLEDIMVTKCICRTEVLVCKQEAEITAVAYIFIEG